MPGNFPRSPSDRSSQSKWLFCIAVSICMLALTYWPNGLVIFRYDPAALLSGEAWRVFTGHLVHLSTAHLLFNVAGLFLLCELLWRDTPVVHGLGLLIAASIGVSGLLFWLHPELAWYAGLSGALHGLWAGCALRGWWTKSSRDDAFLSGWKLVQMRWPIARSICAAGMLLLVAKLAFEFHYGPSPLASHAIGGTVISIAHLYGAFVGAAYALVWRMLQVSETQYDAML